MPEHTYPLPIGTEIDLGDRYLLRGGTVTALTLTAYRVATADGATAFVPFVRVHPLVAATPLVTL